MGRRALLKKTHPAKPQGGWQAGVAGLREKDSPSRVRFRPPRQRTVRFRVGNLGEASSYPLPVLGARPTVGHRVPVGKTKILSSFLSLQRPGITFAVSDELLVIRYPDGDAEFLG